MARPRRGDGVGRSAGSGRGVGRPRRARREPESSDRLQRLEDQLAVLSGLVHQMAQQQAAAFAAPAPSAPPPVEVPAGPCDPPIIQVPPVVIAPAAATTSGAKLEAATASDPPTAIVGTTSLPSRPVTPVVASDAVQAEKARVKAVLMEFKRFNPQTFLGDADEFWAVEQWVEHMEKLFRDLYTEEQDKVHLAAHCLDKGANKWWDRHFREHFEGRHEPSWRDFKEAIYHCYLKDTTKDNLERDLETIRQGDRTIWEYERDFSRIADLIPHAVRDERRKVRFFSQGLRHEIRRQLSSHLISNFDDCVERCLSIEADVIIFRAERQATEKGKEKKRPFSGDGGGSSNKRKPPKHPRSQGQARSASSGSRQQGRQPCIFCGGSHWANTCDQRHGRCYGCGQAGHVRSACPNASSTVQSSASAPAPHRRQALHFLGVPLFLASQKGRTSHREDGSTL